jgi:hypothetical protein
MPGTRLDRSLINARVDLANLFGGTAVERRADIDV